MRLTYRLMMVIVFIYSGCSTKSEHTSQAAGTGEAMSHDQDHMSNEGLSTQKINGFVSETGISQGKTIAAWNGIPPPHHFIVIKLDPEKKDSCQHGDEVYVWFPKNSPEHMENLLGKHIQLSGIWVHPPRRQPANINQPMQQPIELVSLIDLQAPLTLEELDHRDTNETKSSSPPKDLEVKDDKVWVPIDREPHFQASHMTLLN